jgi:uncharacterized membrane protein
VPVQNYVGWVLTTFVVFALYRSLERRWRPQPGRPLSAGAKGMPIAAYLSMLLANLWSGALPAAAAVIGPFAMGVPVVAALLRLRGDDKPAAEPRRARLT